MSRIRFNGVTHEITLLNDSGQALGSWTAYNNVDSHATLTHIANGVYTFQDTQVPHRHTPDANGPYGLHGIFRFNVPGHPGIGLHSGRANAKHAPGPQHATMGCIRTTDDAMASIMTVVRTAPLTVIEVTHNSNAAAHSGSHRYRHHHRLSGHRHG